MRAPIDFRAVESRHPLAEVAQRTGYRLAATSGDVMVCCPMADHRDDTPSMLLHLDTNRYHCFGCEATGDVIQWVRDIYGLRAGEAVAALDAAGPLPEPPGALSGDRRPATRMVAGRSRSERPDLDRTQTTRVLAALRDAWAYLTYGALGRAGRQYLTGRGIDVTALEAQIGAPVVGHSPHRAPDQLVRRLRAKGYSDDELVDAGLARRLPSHLDAGKAVIYDFYQRRVIMAIRDDDNRVIGLIGRYDGDAKADGVPKYLNPPRTALYDKAIALYRPSVPQLDADGQVVAVEGTLDALAIAALAAQHGYSTKFAPLCESGVAYSPLQVERLLALHPRAPILALDGDDVGGDANVRLAVACAHRGRETAIVTWPAGEDPASWLAKHGADALVSLTRRGCLEAPPDRLCPRHSGAVVARHLIEGAKGGVEGKLAAAFAPAAKMSPGASGRYLLRAVETVAPIIVTAAAEASRDGDGRVDDVVMNVAVYGSRLPPAVQVRYAELAALAVERLDLAPAGWAQRRIQATIEARTAQAGPDDGPADHNFTVAVS
jgi:DNA primase